MNPQEIIFKLRLNDWSGPKVGEALGISRSAIGHVIHGRSKTRRVRYFISGIINIPVEDIWPEKEKASETAISKA